ncbi:MAG: hypothetical protein Q9169_005991 [Polycauliona sp. 2 TL-2023]
MRYSSLVALALASTVAALPTPQDESATQDLGTTSQDGASPIGSGTPSDSSASGDIANDFFDMGGEADTASTTEEIETETEDTDSSLTTGASGNGTSSSPGVSTTPADGLQPCGEAFYSPDMYTCYGTFLCPIVDGTATLQCGDACYLESLYTCANNVLQSLDGTGDAGTGGTTTPPTTTDGGEEETDTDDATTPIGTGDGISTGSDDTFVDTTPTDEDMTPTGTEEEGSTMTSGSPDTSLEPEDDTATTDPIPIIPTTATSNSTLSSSSNSTTSPDLGTLDSAGGDTEESTGTGTDTGMEPIPSGGPDADSDSASAAFATDPETGAVTQAAPGSGMEGGSGVAGSKLRREWIEEVFEA